MLCSDLHALETMLPDNNVGSNAIRAVVEKSNPVTCMSDVSQPLVDDVEREASLHSVRVHRLAAVELEVLEVGNHDLLDELLSSSLELLDLLLRLFLLLELSLDRLEVP